MHLSSQTPVAAVRQEKYPYEESIHYYDDGWWKLDNFAPLPQSKHNFSMIVADGKLYMAGSKNSSCDSGDFYRYDAEENKWTSLEPMSKATNHMLYLDGFIYVIHGSGDVERYDVLQNRWEKVQRLPICPARFSAVTFKGRIFACVFVTETRHNPSDYNFYYELLIYHPSKDIWQRTDVMKEQDGDSSDNFFLFVLIFIHKEQCYRIVERTAFNLNAIPVFRVDILDVEVCDDGEVIYTIKDEIKQDPKPDGKNTFCIHNKVFTYDYGTGFVCDVETMKLEPELCEQECKLTSNIVMFTFDKRKTLYKPDSDSDSEADLF